MSPPGTTDPAQAPPANRQPDPAQTQTPDSTPDITGDNIVLPRPLSVISFFYANINGINIQTANKTIFDPILQHIDPSIIGFTEPNLDTTKYEQVTRPLVRAINKTWHHQTTTITSSSETYLHSSSTYKPGGILLSTVGSCCSRTKDKIPDPSGMGRWATHVLSGAQGHTISCIVGYRVPQTNATTCGPLTAAQQQWRSITTTTGQDTANPRATFLHDLQAHIQEQQQKIMR